MGLAGIRWTILLLLCFLPLGVLSAEQDVHVVPLDYVATGGTKNVTTAGTAEALATTTTVSSCLLRARSTNTGNVYVGDSSVDSTWPYLRARDTFTADIGDPAEVFLDVDTNGEGVTYVCLK